MKYDVRCGDALSVLQELPERSVDLVIADPPYSSGGAFRGDRMQSTNTKYVQSGPGGGIYAAACEAHRDDLIRQSPGIVRRSRLGERLRLVDASGEVLDLEAERTLLVLS